ncbi:MAG: hypothetical protein QXT28_09780 [Thermofilaceae archaeon]
MKEAYHPMTQPIVCRDRILAATFLGCHLEWSMGCVVRVEVRAKVGRIISSRVSRARGRIGRIISPRVSR